MPHELYGQLRGGVNTAPHRELARSSLIHLCGPRMKIKLHAPDSAKKQHRHGEQVLGSKVSRWLAQACLCHRLMMAPLWWRRRRALRLNHTRTALYYTYSAAAREGAAVCAAWKKCRASEQRLARHPLAGTHVPSQICEDRSRVKRCERKRLCLIVCLSQQGG